MLSWNIQFGAGRNRCFFYDGGPDARVTREEVETTLEGIGSLIASRNPDVVLLQEVDRRSLRTGNIDQIRVLQRRLGLPVLASTPYFKVPWVPVPPHQPMGHVDMHLVVLSRFALSDGRRLALAPLDEPLYRRVFNLRRALLHLKLATTTGPALDLFQTHLSAFSRGDGTLHDQVRTVLDAVLPCERALLAGDFNCLPVGVDPASLGEAKVLYEADDTPIRPLFEQLDSMIEPAQPSYVPYGSNLPDRTIDYGFSRGLQVLEANTLPEGARWSDHLPLEFSSRL